MIDEYIIDGVDVSECEYFGSTMSPMKNCTMDSEYLHACRGCNCYYKQLDQLKAENEQAEQKLERIREICKPYLLFRGYSGQCVNTNEFTKLCKELAKDILQIISEVEDDRQD